MRFTTFEFKMNFGRIPYIATNRFTSQWRHTERYAVSNHRRLDYLLNRLFERRSTKTSKLCVTGLCEGNSAGTGEFPTQMASDAQNVSIWWRHHDKWTKPYLQRIHLVIAKDKGYCEDWDNRNCNPNHTEQDAQPTLPETADTEHCHYCDVTMSPTASQITSRLTIIYSIVYSGTDQRKHQSSASVAFVLGIHRWPVNSPHKGPVTRTMFPFDDVIMFPFHGPVL